jgi:hypothetical protein
VFWVHASNAARFEESFREVADRLMIPGRQKQTANIFQLVRDWLCDERKGKWVLILDNVDDAGFLVEARRTGQEGQTSGTESGKSRSLVSYLPHCPHGSILITTRTKLAALQLVEDNSLIAVEPMDKVDAVALLEKKLGMQEDSVTDGNISDIGELAAVLEYMPLAIVQAAAYICQRAPRCSVSEYLDEFRKSDREKTSLLDYKAGQLRQDREAKSSIIITWHISFEHIRQSRPLAADLLSLMSLFDRQGIPERLIRNRNEIETSNQIKRNNQQKIWSRGNQRLKSLVRYNRDRNKGRKQDANSDERGNEFEDNLLVLRNYAFVSISEMQSTFEMHALVQLAMRMWLEARGDLERWTRYYCKILSIELPTGEYENWARCQELFPHAQSAMARQPEDKDTLRDWATILYRAGWYAWRIGSTNEAEKLVQSSLQVRRGLFGQSNTDTIYSMMLLGHIYKDGDQWEEAELLDIQVMETSKKKFGADHPDTLKSIGNLATTYKNQGRWDAAKELEVHVIGMSKKKLGTDHLDTLSSMTNLATTYRNEGRWDAAKELELQVIETRKKKFGADYPNTLYSINNLASTFLMQGRWDAAKELFVQVTETNKKKLSADHPNTLTSMGNLASIYRNQGRWDAAEELELQVMETREKKFGADHLDTLTSMANLASTY